MPTNYKNIADELNKSIEDLENDIAADAKRNDIGYPVQVQFIEFKDLYMNRIQWQWHPEITIFIVNHGDINLITNDSALHLTAGEGVIINSNVMHSLEPSGLDINASMYSVSFNTNFIFGHGNEYMSDKFLTPITNSTNFKYLHLAEDDKQGAVFLETVNLIIADNLIKKFGYELSTRARLCNLWLTLLDTVLSKENSKKATAASTDEVRAKEIMSFIERHYSEKITLDELADSVSLSRSECCRCFKRALNLTPIEYLMKYRIYKAASLIQNEDPLAASFSELAFNVGFNNASYFNKVFRQYLGCTPSEYKKKIKSGTVSDPFKNLSV